MQKLLVMLLLAVNIFALEIYQYNNLKIGYAVGSGIVADDNTTFEQALSTIMLTESSAGRDAIGDIEKESYYYMHMGKRVYLNDKKNIDKIYREDGKLYYPYKPKDNVYKKRVYSAVVSKTELSDASLGACQVRIPTAIRTIKLTPELAKYMYLIYNEKALINKLLTDVKFNAALKNKSKLPYFEGISQQNGGKRNYPYWERFKKNRKIIRDNINIISNPEPIVVITKSNIH